MVTRPLPVSGGASARPSGHRAPYWRAAPVKAGLSVATVFAVLLPAAPTLAAAGPDLQTTAITYQPTKPVAGAQVHFDSGVQNAGDVGTGVFNIKWYVNGAEVGAYGSHAGVPAKTVVMNGNSQFDWTFAAPGHYTVTFKVDVDGHVAESNENNNSRTIALDVAAAGGGSAAPSPSQPSPSGSSPSGGQCTRLVFLGLRGTGEKAFASENNLGTLIYTFVFSEIFQRANSDNIPWQAAGPDVNGYPAADIGPLAAQILNNKVLQGEVTSVRTGVAGLATLMDKAVAQKDACIALVGYSQGAWVIGDYLGAHPERRSRVTAVVLFGDPRSPGHAVGSVTQGSVAAPGAVRYLKIADPAYYYEDMQNRVRSYCLPGDPVCNATVANAKNCPLDGDLMFATCPHLWYPPSMRGDAYTDAGTAFLVGKLGL
jgi:pimeloyl-ACP methyl ester carboxylesterase